jgi:phosphoribosyl 1,2-cyclic phosphodiesterase
MQGYLFAQSVAIEHEIAGVRCGTGSLPSLVVLASSSGGNCSVLILEHADGGLPPSLILIDLGVTPRRAARLLAAAGLGGLPIVAAIVTHLDTDHLCPSWCRNTREAAAILPPSAPLYMHRRHAGRADRQGLLFRRTLPYTDAFEPAPGVAVRARIAPHDELGSAALRFTVATPARTVSLGWATDLGRPTDEIAEHLAGVDVLGLESNYCPEMEADADRPEFLKRRVMGGSGHLSNEQSADLARRIAPREHVVLLHLSRQCNTPERAAAGHAGASYATTISTPDTPTVRIEIGAGLLPRACPPIPGAEPYR